MKFALALAIVFIFGLSLDACGRRRCHSCGKGCTVKAAPKATPKAETKAPPLAAPKR